MVRKINTQAGAAAAQLVRHNDVINDLSHARAGKPHQVKKVKPEVNQTQLAGAGIHPKQTHIHAVEVQIYGSRMEEAHFLQSFRKTIEANYSLEYTSNLTAQYIFVPPLASLVYILIIFTGKRWMKNRSAFDLRILLTLWNCFLATFSIVGFVILAPPVFQLVLDKGFIYSACNSLITHTPWLSFWALLFVYSKLAELGDTIFIILRKTPLSFLHWYHHITVLAYSWHGLATKNSTGHWFCAMNLGVHSVMYSYYMFKAMGFRISSSIAKSITVLQLLQFVVGLILLVVGMWAGLAGHPCQQHGTSIKAGVIVYGSYLILFLNFFYHRYMKPSKEKSS